MDDLVLAAFYGIGGAVTCGIAGFFMLDRFNRGWAGWWWGFLLGPFGVLIAWVKRDNAIQDEQRAEERRAREKEDYGKMMAALRRPEPQRAATVSAIDELERLASLKEKGHVTEEEFNARKRQLLGGAPTQPSQPQRFK